MTTHELILADIVDRPDGGTVNPLASLVAIGNDAYPFIRRFLDVWYPGCNDFILSHNGRSRGALHCNFGRIAPSLRGSTAGMPIVDASVLWSFIATDPAYQHQE